MKRIFLSFLGIFVVLSAYSQRRYEPNFAIGAKGGVTMSRMSFSPHVEQSFVQGVMMGIMARYTEENNFGIIGELNIEQRGWKEFFEPDDGDFRYDRKLTYIQLPLLTHIYFGGKRVKGFFNIGPSFGYMIGSTITSNFDYANPKDVPGFPLRHRTTEQMAMEISSKFDYGIAGGLGVELFLKPKHSIMLEGRYYYGIGNIFPDSKRDFFQASRGMSIEVTLGYFFRVR